MGWTTTYKAKHESAKEYIETHLLKWTSDTHTYKVLDGGVVKFRTYYGAVEKTNNATGERSVFAVIILLSYHKDGYYNFGYKDMSEDMGPCQAECPERILKLLTPTESKYANDWANLLDTHYFFGMLKKHHLNRLQAFELIGEHYAEPLSRDAVGALLNSAAHLNVPIMIFVGNRGAIQIHTGQIKRVLDVKGWLNILVS